MAGRRSLIRILALGGVVALASSCGDPSAVIAEGSSTTVGAQEGPGFELGVGYPVAAAAGSNAVLFNSAWFHDEGAPLGAVLDEGGQWHRLPDPPARYYSAALASVDEHAVLAGIMCSVESCDDSRMQFARLSADFSRWETFGSEPEINVPEPEVTAVPGKSDSAVFVSSGGSFAVSGEAITLLPENDDRAPGGSSVCLVGEDLLVLRAPATNIVDGLATGPIEYEASSFRRLSLGNPEDGWTDLPMPPSTLAEPQSGVCSASGLVFLSEGVETSFDLQRLAWSDSTPANVNQSADGQAVTGPNGNLFEVLHPSGEVHTRQRPGDWVPLEQEADRLIATSSAVYAIVSGSAELHRLN